MSSWCEEIGFCDQQNLSGYVYLFVHWEMFLVCDINRWGYVQKCFCHGDISFMLIPLDADNDNLVIQWLRVSFCALGDVFSL